MGGEIVPEIIHLSVHKIVSEEWDNIVIKPYFLQNEGKEVMVKRREELCDIKSKYAYQKILNPTRLNNVCEGHTRICHRSEFQAL